MYVGRKKCCKYAFGFFYRIATVFGFYLKSYRSKRMGKPTKNKYTPSYMYIHTFITNVTESLINIRNDLNGHWIVSRYRRRISFFAAPRTMHDIFEYVERCDYSSHPNTVFSFILSPRVRSAIPYGSCKLFFNGFWFVAAIPSRTAPSRVPQLPWLCFANDCQYFIRSSRRTVRSDGASYTAFVIYL